jgi:tetratricopeptide (TPR) repeat protein
VKIWLIAASLACLIGCSSSDPPRTEGGTAPPPVASSLKSGYESAKSEFEADATKNKAFSKAASGYAYEVMTGDGAPRVKYGEALKLYGEALKADPSNADARKNRDMILAIYKQMGKTPPTQ